MKSIADLEFFVYLCEAGSLSRAAKDLDITPAAASKRLANMEKALETQLFYRTPRAMSVTPDGVVMLRYAKRMLADMASLQRALKVNSDDTSGQIRINAPFGFGRRHIAPFVATFVEQYPGIDCQLQLSDHPLNLVANAFDIGIRFGSLPDSGLHARKIASHRRLLCASPAYLDRHGHPRTPEELSDHNCIVLRQNDDTYGNWRFTRGERHHQIKVRGNLSANDGESVLTWAMRGHGIAVRAEWDVHEHLAQGRLVQVLPDYQLPNADIYAVYPYADHLPTRIRRFIDHLVSEMQALPCAT